VAVAALALGTAFGLVLGLSRAGGVFVRSLEVPETIELDLALGGGLGERFVLAATAGEFGHPPLTGLYYYCCGDRRNLVIGCDSTDLLVKNHINSHINNHTAN
jgi:hypothetical protein